jgi:hypothetical protein
MKKIFKAALAFNFAGMIRGTRCGAGDAARRLVDAYDGIDPFGLPSALPATLRQLQALPAIDLCEAVPALPVVWFDSGYSYMDGAMPAKDLTALLALLIVRKPEMILEIGTFFGTTTRALALNAPGAKVHTVDLPLDFNPVSEPSEAMLKDDFHLIKARRVGQAFGSTPEAKQIVQHLVDTANWDFQPAKGSSFFFIDGAHTYEYIKNDTEKCFSIAAPQARFVWHDVDDRHPGVVRYLHELAGPGRAIRRIKETALAFFDLSA